jgi:hypothetical protein
MKNRILCLLALCALGFVMGCGPKEAETPPGALEPRKMVRPDGMGDPRTMTPEQREQMRKQSGR